MAGHRSPVEATLASMRAALEARRPWEALWRDAYEFALPGRGWMEAGASAERRSDRLFDGTAPDAVERLAASLLGQLTPPWSRWFALEPGEAARGPERDALVPVLDVASRVMQSHFDRSNFAVELHQAFLDLVVGGTGCLLLEEAAPGEGSALRFTAVPLQDVVLAEGGSGRLDRVWRRSRPTRRQFAERFPGAELPAEIERRAERESDLRLDLVEAVEPEGGGYCWRAILDMAGEPVLIKETALARSPFVAFRWLKAPGEAWGRSPVMTALPDIRCANKVVELVLKNASIAVTGIWQADDDGVLNPAAIRLVPGSIIPKAVGSAGLTPLEAPGRFDISELVLGDLRRRIRSALLVDRLAEVEGPRMTATEVLERAAETALLLGATYGRLQAELLGPLIRQTHAILRRRGEIPDLPIDGRVVALAYLSPVARAQGQSELRSALLWLDSLKALGPEAQAAVDIAGIARWTAERFGVPATLLRDPDQLLSDPILT